MSDNYRDYMYALRNRWKISKWKLEIKDFGFAFLLFLPNLETEFWVLITEIRCSQTPATHHNLFVAKNDGACVHQVCQVIVV